MSAQIPFAKFVSTSRIVHINELPIGSKEEFTCCEYKSKLIPVKTKVRKKDWHFRHFIDADIEKCKKTALHDFAVQLLLENSSIVLSKEFLVNYSNASKEKKVGEKYRSDVSVKYQSEVLHFEIFVTHDLEQHKIDFYESANIKCCRIDLSEKSLLTASPETIQDLILNQYNKKTLLGWKIPPRKMWYEKAENLFGILILSVIGYFTFFGKSKRRR